MTRLWTAPSTLWRGLLPSPSGGPDSGGSGSHAPGRRGSHAPGRRLGAVLLVAIGVLGLVGCDPAPPDRATSSSTSIAPAAGRETGCAPTRGEPAQGTRAVAADAPSTARLGPGGEVERTAETVAAGRDGQQLAVSGTVYQADCRTPLAGASIEVWQANAAGEYGPGQGTGDERCCYLAAALRTDARGRYRFETVRPGHYKGEERPPPAHIHFEIRHPDAAGVLTELLFEGDPWLGPDPPGGVVRLEPVPGSDPPALAARFDIVLGAVATCP
jgi:protocatechuate 3,4-dioxygenase beta subunit